MRKGRRPLQHFGGPECQRDVFGIIVLEPLDAAAAVHKLLYPRALRKEAMEKPLPGLHLLVQQWGQGPPVAFGFGLEGADESSKLVAFFVAHNTSGLHFFRCFHH